MSTLLKGPTPVLVVTCALVLACSSQDYEAEFQVNGQDYITSDPTKAQQQEPFVILLPKSLPRPEISWRLEVKGRLKDHQQDHLDIVRIRYHDPVGPKEIRIQETNRPTRSLSPEKNPGLERLSLSGIEVIRVPIGFQSRTVEEFQYACRGVFIIITLAGLNVEEGLSLIQAMTPSPC